MLYEGHTAAAGPNSDLETISKRLDLVNPRHPWPDHIVGKSEEFLQLLGDRVGTIVPYTLTQVYEHMTKPSQRSSFTNYIHNIVSNSFDAVISSFMKREPYPERKDPRNISNVDPKHTISFSRYTLALSDKVKQIPWYGFGYTYHTMGELVMHRACSSSNNIVLETDMSRFDGTMTSSAHQFCEKLYKRVFP